MISKHKKILKGKSLLKKRLRIHKRFAWLLSSRIRIGRVKIAPLLLLFLVFCLPATLKGYIMYAEKNLQKRYDAVSQKESLIGDKLPKLASLITESKKDESKVYLFNKQDDKEPQPGIDKPLSTLNKNIVSEDSSLKPQYSAEIATEKPAMSISDIQKGIDFGAELLLETEPGVRDGSWVVYPAKDKNLSVVYSLKNNGIKEDIIVNKALSDEMSFSYKLNLGESLDAKLLDDGSLGIYSADPALYSNITFGSEADRELIDKVKAKSEKTHLVFVIPKPVIVAENGNIGEAVATFKYDRESKILNVKSYNLLSIEGMFSIDPTTVITTTADFISGNDEGNIDFTVSNALNTATFSGGKVGSWTNQTSSDCATSGCVRVDYSTTVYNGYIYMLGGWLGAGVLSDKVQRAPLNTDGTIGTWTDDTDSVLPAVRGGGFQTIGYNGKLYILGGCGAYSNAGAGYYYCTSRLATVHYATLDLSTGNIVGGWTATTSFTTGREWFAAGVYNNRLYVAGGWSVGYPSAVDNLNTVQYASINTDGTVGSWTDGGSNFTTDRAYLELEIYNGYMYVVGGFAQQTNTELNDVQYAPIKEDGSIGTWTTTNSFSVTRENMKATIYRGYLYVAGGYDGTADRGDTQYAPINTNGSIGTFGETTSFTATAGHDALFGYGNYLYWMTGDYVNNIVWSASLVAGGGVQHNSSVAWPTSSTTSTFRNLTSLVAYNGNMYQVGGGNTSATPQTSTDRVAINADGTLGTWTTSGGGTLGTARQAHGVAVYNGYIYAVGGLNTSGNPISSIEYAPINADGTIGTWNTTTSLSGNRAYIDVVAYRGYMYVLGGDDFGGGGGTTVEYFTIDSAGTLSSRTAGTSLPATASNPSATAYNGYIYISGGDNSSTNTVRSTLHYASISSNGSIGSWTATTSLPSNRSGHTLSTHNGILYLAGGCTTFSGSVCTTWTNAVHSAPINTDGTIGTFTATTSLANNKWNHGATIYNGYMYVINGRDGSNRHQTEVARLNASGAGATLAWTSSANSLGTATTKQQSIAYNGYLYTLGGCTTYVTSNCTAFSSAVQYSAINPGGTLGTSSTTTSFTTGRYGHALAIKDNYIYLLGGCSASSAGTCTNYLNDVQVGRIESNGTIGSWQTTTSFTTARHSHRAVISGNYIYISGGTTGTIQTGVQYATINTNASFSLSSWTATSSLSNARESHGFVAYNGYVYALGGYSGSAALSSVEYAVVNGDGTLGTWTASTPLVMGLYGHGAAVYNGRMYVSGGCSAGACTTYNSKTHQAEVFSNGQLHSWDTSINNFTTARTDAGFAIYEGNLYVTGGCSAGTCTTIQSNISHTGLTVYPFTSEYSRQIDLTAGGSDLESFTYTGTGLGAVNFSYRVACATSTYGTRTPLAYDVASGERILFDNAAADYLIIFIALDSSLGRSFPVSTLLQIQDITIGYSAAHPDPNQQMRHGNAFINEVEAGFDVRAETVSSLGC